MKAIEFFENQGFNLDCVVLKKSRIWHLRFYLSIIFSLFRGRPLQVGLFDNAKNRKALINLRDTNEYDRVYFHLVRSTFGLRLFSKAQIFVGMQISYGLNYQRVAKQLPLGIKKIIFQLEGKLCKRYETNLLKFITAANLVAQKDADFITEGNQTSAKVTAIPHGADTLENKPTIQKTSDIIFLANFASQANLLALDFSWVK